MGLANLLKTPAAITAAPSFCAGVYGGKRRSWKCKFSFGVSLLGVLLLAGSWQVLGRFLGGSVQVLGIMGFNLECVRPDFFRKIVSKSLKNH